MLNKLTSPNNSRKARKRIGRGTGSGLGKTSGKGHKGQKARSGNGHRRRIGFEGGQMPLHRRLPKFGFVSDKNSDLLTLSLKQILNSKKIDKSQVISLQTLIESGYAQKTFKRLKVIGAANLTTALKIKSDLASKGAVELIKKAGGSIELSEDAVVK